MAEHQKQLDYPDPFAAPGYVPAGQRAPAVADSPSSRAAAAAIEPRVARLERRVLDLLIRSPGGLTDRQIQQRLGMSGDTERPRRVWLVKHGYVENRNGKTRQAGGARAAAVWFYTGKRIEGTT
jgi:hypothetical protein